MQGLDGAVVETRLAQHVAAVRDLGYLLDKVLDLALWYDLHLAGDARS